MYKKTPANIQPVSTTQPKKTTVKTTIAVPDKKNETHAREFRNKDEQLLAMVK